MATFVLAMNATSNFTDVFFFFLLCMLHGLYKINVLKGTQAQPPDKMQLKFMSDSETFCYYQQQSMASYSAN